MSEKISLDSSDLIIYIVAILLLKQQYKIIYHLQ